MQTKTAMAKKLGTIAEQSSLSTSQQLKQPELPQSIQQISSSHSSVTNEQPAATNNQLDTLVCQSCQKRFASRNALFRHLKSDLNTCGAQSDVHKTTKQTIAVELSYYRRSVHNLHLNDGASAPSSQPQHSSSDSLARIAADRLQAALETVLTNATIVGGQATDATATNSTLQFAWLAQTQASQARMRSSVLTQEPDCAAAGDVLVITIEMDDRKASQIRREPDVFVKQVQDVLDEIESDNVSNDSDATAVRVCSVKWLAPQITLHAERSATQMVYHYIMPISWLPDCEQLLRWTQCLDENQVYVEALSDGSTTRWPPESLKRFKRALQVFQSIRLTRQHDTESADDDASASTAKSLSTHSSAPRVGHRYRRFGALAYHQPRAWHNFADPTLQGQVSPNHQVAWRSVDQARLVGFCSRSKDNDNDNDSEGRKKYDHLVVEFKGDAFLPQQVRRIVAMSLAMSHSEWWKSSDTDNDDGDEASGNEMQRMTVLAEQWTQPQSLLPTPIAPAHRLYLAQVRFHSYERSQGGSSTLLFESDNGGPVCAAMSCDEALHNIQEAMLQAVSANVYEEAEWLHQLQHVDTPRIRNLLEDPTGTPVSSIDVANGGVSNTAGDHDGVPPPTAPSEYGTVLSMLQDLVATKQWPATSAARSTVLQRADSSVPGGSFTVVNPLHAYYKDSANSDSNGSKSDIADETECGNEVKSVATPSGIQNRMPMGNRLFPELVQAVFDLERRLGEEQAHSNSQLEPHVVSSYENGSNAIVKPSADVTATDLTGSSSRVSSHCAINANAAFTPHVDSGQGAGQSLSMIVGLGDYTGGELCVEDAVHDIRYQPLEFDGWKLRHWTRPFSGERFSLVWFTPELKGSN
jgi:hypothetical protein